MRRQPRVGNENGRAKARRPFLPNLFIGPMPLEINRKRQSASHRFALRTRKAERRKSRMLTLTRSPQKGSAPMAGRDRRRNGGE